jgi:hypothetical protein
VLRALEEKPMPEYQLYFLDAKGHVYRRQDLVCANDNEAIAIAKALRHPHGMELWCGVRTVRKFEAPED